MMALAIIGIGIIGTLYVISSIVLMIYGFQCYIMTFLFLRSRKNVLQTQHEKMAYFDTVTDESRYPTVVTQLPMYNEKSVAVRIIDAVAAIDYPKSKHEIQILDDSTDETKEYVDEAVARYQKQGVIISVIRRIDRVGYKAGALQNALKYTAAEYVAIFDADFVPNPDFLKKSIPFFISNKKIGFVQGRWTHLNKNSSMVTRTQAAGIDGHFMIEQAARSWNNLFMNFNGTAGLFRREAIENSGGWHHDTLTEDMDLSYRMQLKGWQTEYVPDLEVPAEIPEDMNAFKNQQFRWAKGTMQTAMKIIPRLSKAKLSWFKYYQAILHLTFYLVHPFMLLLALLTMPVLSFAKVSLPPWIFVPIVIGMFLSTTGPSMMYIVAQHYLGNNKVKFLLMVPIMMLSGIGLAINNTKAVLEALLGRESPFHRTPKKGEGRFQGYRPIKDITCILEILVGLYCIVCFQMFVSYSSMFVSPFLALYGVGFLYVGVLSIIHFRRPELIDLKPAWLARATA
jgi:cellulose synthase/poly-beta-1,6-N-acetylglucosamine synthase-like glycosyltransferase